MTVIYFFLISFTFIATDKIFKKSIILKIFFYFYFIWSLSVILLSFYLDGDFIIDQYSMMQFLKMINLLLLSVLITYLICLFLDFPEKKIFFLREKIKDKLSLYNNKKIFFYLNLFIILGSLMLILFGIGLNQFIFGHYYLETNSQVMRVVGSNLIFFSVISLILSIFIFDKKITLKNFIIIFLVIIIFSAIDSRRVVVVITILSSLLLFKKNNSFNLLKIIFVLLIGIYVNSFIISFRYSEQVGLLNLINYLFQKNDNFLSYNLIDTLNNILKGGYVFIKMSEGSNFQATDLITGLNPLTSNFTNWYERVYFLRVNPTIPYNILGELYYFNIYVFFLYFLIVGMIMSFIENICFKNITSEKPNTKYFFLLPIILALFGMFLIYSTQYNLRACNRFIVYSVFLFFLFQLKINFLKTKNI